MLPLRGARINSVVVKSLPSCFLDTEAFDNGMTTITKREACHESTECRPIGAADEHCPVPRTLLHGRIRLLTPTESEIVVADPFTGLGDGTGRRL
jgi:hypothetical protein